jgi:hypothetical protein
MKSITIHDLDEPLEAMIEEKAREEGLSLNKTVKRLLRKALGLEEPHNGERKGDFAEFSGVWSKADGKEFAKATRDLRRVDLRDWQ